MRARWQSGHNNVALTTFTMNAILASEEAKDYTKYNVVSASAPIPDEAILEKMWNLAVELTAEAKANCGATVLGYCPCEGGLSSRSPRTSAATFRFALPASAHTASTRNSQWTMPGFESDGSDGRRSHKREPLKWPHWSSCDALAKVSPRVPSFAIESESVGAENFSVYESAVNTASSLGVSPYENTYPHFAWPTLQTSFAWNGCVRLTENTSAFFELLHAAPRVSGNRNSKAVDLVILAVLLSEGCSIPSRRSLIPITSDRHGVVDINGRYAITVTHFNVNWMAQRETPL